MKVDIRYKFLSNEGYIFTYLLSQLARFERFIAIDNVFENNLPQVRKSNKLVKFEFWDQR